MEIIFTDLKFAKKLIPLDKNKVDTIFIHHPAISKATPEQIHQWHLDRGFNGFGYNEYIRKDGKVYIGRGDYIGAQAENYNSRSYGICLEGNYDIEIPPDYLINIVAERVIETQRRFPKDLNVLPHSARYNTSCPGKNFPMNKLYDQVNRLNKKQSKITDIDEALKILAEIGVTNSPTYWKNSIQFYKHIDELILNFANYIVGLKGGE